MITDLKDFYNKLTHYPKYYPRYYFKIIKPDIIKDRYFISIKSGQVTLKNIEISTNIYNKIIEFLKVYYDEDTFEVLYLFDFERLIIQERNNKLQKI